MAWPRSCVWCERPIAFLEMEVEHLIPKSLAGEDRVAALAIHGKPPTFDLFAEENLAPSCRRCNGEKGTRTPPLAPRITLLLELAAERADRVRRAAARGSSK